MDKVDSSRVKEIVSTSKTDISEQIDHAHSLAEPLDLPEARRELIEIWLAAHFIKVDEKELSDKKVGDERESYRGEDGLGLQSTTYGQQAIALDTTGSLSGGKGSQSVTVKHTG